MFRICSAAALLGVLALPAVADPSGRISVVDGDTFDIGGERVRLFGIDAPEGRQTCADRAGQPWECGAWVTEQVRARFDGRRASCEQVDRDIYGRTVARCRVDGADVGETLVAEGLALAYREYSWDYDLTEKAAQLAGVGIWRGSVQAPAEYRAEQRAEQPGQEPSGDCIIKGNISASGQIYHMPHNRDYAATRIDEARGERWFCSEAEARAAGWRPARN